MIVIMRMKEFKGKKRRGGLKEKERGERALVIAHVRVRSKVARQGKQIVRHGELHEKHKMRSMLGRQGKKTGMRIGLRGQRAQQRRSQGSSPTGWQNGVRGGTR